MSNAMAVPAADKPPARVLLIKPSSLGDVIGAIPVLRGLHRSFPNAKVSWLVNKEYVPLLAGEADLQETIIFDRRKLGKLGRSWSAWMALRELIRTLKSRRFDWVIDLQGLFRSGYFARATGAHVRAGFSDARELAGLFYTHRIHAAQTHTVAKNVELAKAMGVDARIEDLTLTVSAEQRKFSDDFCDEHGIGKGEFLVCTPPTRWANKRYPVRHWRTVVAAMSKRMPVVLMGAAGDEALCADVAEAATGKSRKESCGVVNAAGATTIPQMVALIAASRGVICSDSAAQYVAPAVGVPVLVLVGPTQPERTGPLPPGRAITADVACQGCRRRACRHATCMESIAPADVVIAAEEMLGAGLATCTGRAGNETAPAQRSV